MVDPAPRILVPAAQVQDRHHPDTPLVRCGLAGTVIGLIPLVAIGTLYPEVFGGPYREVNEVVRQAFLANVQEAEPLLTVAPQPLLMQSLLLDLFCWLCPLPSARPGDVQEDAWRGVFWPTFRWPLFCHGLALLLR